MQDHTSDPGVYIRSMATRGHLGGLSLATLEAVRVLDAAGWPWIVIETVGVGQVEVEVAGAADTTVVVVNPGWGDAVQANKAGLLEIADVFVINKADRPGVAETRRDLERMLDLTDRDGLAPADRRHRRPRRRRASTSCGPPSATTVPTSSRTGELEPRRRRPGSATSSRGSSPRLLQRAGRRPPAATGSSELAAEVADRDARPVDGRRAAPPT